MASLKDKVVEIAYRLKDQFSNQVSRVTGSIRKIDDASKRSADSIERSNARAGGSFVSLGKAAKGFLAVLSIRQLANVGQRTLDAADKIQKLSIRLGASTEALSQLRYVADLSGVSFNTLTLGLQRMTRRVAEAAQGTGEAKDALRELGLDAEKLVLQRPEEQFESIADAMLNVGSQADKVRLAMKLFDTEGVSLLQTMEKGAAGIRAFRKEADEAGLTLTREMADKAAEANDKMTELNATMDGITQTLTIGLAPALTAIGEQLDSELKDIFTFAEAIDTFRSKDDDWFPVDLNEWDLLTMTADQLREKLDAVKDLTEESNKNLAGMTDETRNAASETGNLEESLVDVRREVGMAEQGMAGYIDAVGKAVKEADALRDASHGFVNEIDALLNPGESSLTDVYTDLRQATRAIETGDLETANSLFERMQGTLRDVARDGAESNAEIETWARRVRDLGLQLADLRVDEDKLNFIKAEEDVDRLTQKLQALQNVKVTVDVDVNDGNLQQLLQEIHQVQGGASGSWDDLLDEADKRGT